MSPQIALLEQTFSEFCIAVQKVARASAAASENAKPISTSRLAGSVTSRNWYQR